MNTIKRGDVFFCLGSPDAVGSEERKTRPVVIVQNNAGNASSPTVIVANMTTNTTRRLYPMQFDIDLPGHALSRVHGDDIFLALAQKGLSVAVCPLPVLNQVNITVTDGKNVAITRNVAAAAGGIIDEIRDMKSTIAEVAK